MEPGHAIRYATAFLLPFLATLWLTPLAGRLATRLGLLDRPAAHKFHREATPYLGGLAVAGGLALVAWVNAGASGQLVTILLGGLALALVGLADDWRPLGPSVKLLVQVAAGAALWVAGVRAGFFGVYVLDLALTVLWVVAVTNAMNLLDNMDGLSSGTAAIAALSFFAIAAARGDYLVGSFALALAGASVGFLRHNFPPAKIFLGDAGSLMLGFTLAAVGLKLDLIGESGWLRASVPVLILGVPIFDTALVVLARLRRGSSLFVGGTDHTSHRLASLGMSTRAVALVTFSIQLILSGLALWLVGAPANVALAVDLALGGILGLALFALLRIPVEAARPAFAADPPPVAPAAPATAPLAVAGAARASGAAGERNASWNER